MVVALAVVFGGGIVIGRWAIGDRSSSAATKPATTPTTAALAPPSTDTSVLSRLIVQQSDVGPTLNVVLLPSGDQTSQPTLDLCNGSYATESQRTARLQDIVQDTSGTSVVSTEAVLYGTPAESAQAFAELKSVAAKCPQSPVASPVGEPTVTTHFDACRPTRTGRRPPQESTGSPSASRRPTRKAARHRRSRPTCAAARR